MAHLILRWGFSMVFCDFMARELTSIPTAPMVALTEFFQADAEANVHPLPCIMVFLF